jgi:hypothetical protein
VGSIIATDRGIRRLLKEELAKAKGIPEEWLKQGKWMGRSIEQVTDLHIWTAVSTSLRCSTVNQPVSTTSASSAIPKAQAGTDNFVTEEVWEWSPPDLSEGGEWHQARVANLRKAVAGLPDADVVYQEGLKALRVHKRNYEEDGIIHQLQLLWWEFPPEHWEALRNGCSMNFLTEPQNGIVENAPMTEEQVEIAADFVDELQAIGVFEEIPEGYEMKANCPLFAVAKPGQPGQWRIIADMKNGGQNAHIGKDPVHLPRAKGILEHLYTGGWSAIVDASKFFHNFPTRASDRPYLGCIHPRTGKKLWYLGLPMGSSQSPALACRYGVAMLRLLLEQEDVFQGDIQENCWRTKLNGSGYDPKHGTGLIRIGKDGLPSALVWAFVDDFKIHAPTREKLIKALNAFMNLSLRLGFICQKVKTKPPGQVQKYCGFLYETTGIPTFSIPNDKRSRGLAMIRFLRAGGSTLELSRLTLAVVTGLLQSLVEATPQRIGQTYLRRLYDRLHQYEEEDAVRNDIKLLVQYDDKLLRPSGTAFYCTKVDLDESTWLDLNWWETFLQSPQPVLAYSSQQGTLGVSFGDGSGSGTGGTVQILNQDGTCPTMEVWMGTWRMCVHSFSSNWKELRTLVYTLERESDRNGRLRGATLFYFTDNLVTYYIVASGSSSSPELQKLIRRLKHLEIIIGIRLEVVHVPGTHMIDQGADGLSRGLRLSFGHRKLSPSDEVKRIFAGVPVTSGTVAWAAHAIRAVLRHPYLQFMNSSQSWRFENVVGRATLWFPAPEWAHQLIDHLVSAWIESPWRTEVFFLIPRVFQRDWGRVSKHVVEVGTFAAAVIPDYADHTDIPCVMLHLPCYIRSLPPCRRMEPPPRPKGGKWHRAQAEHMRGMS